jgi:hypothetical protein
MTLQCRNQRQQCHCVLTVLCHRIRCKFFVRLYHDALGVGVPSSQVFLQCREATIHWAAVLFAEHLINNLIQEYPGQSDVCRSPHTHTHTHTQNTHRTRCIWCNPNHQQQESLLNVIDSIQPTPDWEHFIRAVMQVVDKRTPCAAVHPRYLDIQCKQSQLGHECHRSPKKVKHVMDDDSVAIRVLKGVGVGFRPVWAGEFVEPFEVSTQYDNLTFQRCMTQYLHQVRMTRHLSSCCTYYSTYCHSLTSD